MNVVRWLSVPIQLAATAVRVDMDMRAVGSIAQVCIPTMAQLTKDCYYVYYYNVILLYAIRVFTDIVLSKLRCPYLEPFSLLDQNSVGLISDIATVETTKVQALPIQYTWV